MGENHMFIIELNAEHRIGKQFSNHATELDHIFFRQTHLLQIFGTLAVKWA